MGRQNLIKFGIIGQRMTTIRTLNFLLILLFSTNAWAATNQCVQFATNAPIDCVDSVGSGSGDLLADGTVPLTADWNAGNSLYDITAVEFKGALVGNSSTTTALATDPTNCATATHFAVGVNASGVPDCEAIADADVPNTITVDLAATVTTNANLTGEVTSVGNAAVIVESFLQENGTSEVLGETLGTACTENQILKANASGD